MGATRLALPVVTEAEMLVMEIEDRARWIFELGRGPGSARCSWRNEDSDRKRLALVPVAVRQNVQNNLGGWPKMGKIKRC